MGILVAFSQNDIVFAKDKCKDISDDSDKVKCYEEMEAQLQSKLTDTKNRIEGTLGKITQLSSQLGVTTQQLNDVQSDIDDIKKELEIINTNLQDRHTKLADKINLRNKIIRSYSKKNSANYMEMFLTKEGSLNFNGFQWISFLEAYNRAANNEVIKLIGALNSEIRGFESDKTESEKMKTDLENAQNKLIALKNDLNNKKATAQSEVNNLEEQKSDYEKELEGLQDKILSLKSSDENGSVGDYEPPEASTPSPKFKPAFAVFSYGAYTHYNGMSQYGAKGRAEAKQSYSDILKFYYKSGTSKKSGFPSSISVQGYGNLDFQYYLYGIAEMPTNWPIEALKAQAIAARTYAYKSNKPICTSQSCQVFSKSKADQVKAGKYPNWKKAVDDTKGEILSNSTTAQYSSTTGGYINNIGWDIKGKWPGDAYEKKAGSPWFYKAWYTKSYADTSNCGRSGPWLTEEEMADILNAWVVWSKGSSKDKSRISPTTKSCWGGNPYSIDEMAKVADKYGTSYEKVTSVDATISNGGYTSSIKFGTDKGSVTVDGSVFKTVFNLRAPGYISVKSRLFDLEKRD